MSGTYLAVGPLPPPIGGDTVSFSRMVESRYWQQAGITLEVLDTSRKDQESKLVRSLDRSDLKNAVRFFLAAWRAKKRVDGILLWANNRFAYTIGILFILLYHFSGKKVIVKIFGGDFDEEMNRLPGWWKLLNKRVFANCDYVLPQTRQLCRFFIEQVGLRSEQVVHFPNFLPFEPLPPASRSFNHQPHAVFVGQIRAEKGIFDIFNALQHAPDWECTFYGPIFAEEREEFFRLLAQHPQAHYGGVIERTEILTTLAPYDVLLLPSYHPGEGYPAAILEAFFSSIPVISTKWRMIPELVQHEINGFLVEIKSPLEIANYLRYLQVNPYRHQAMCEKAHETALNYQEGRIIGEILLPLVQNETKSQPMSVQNVKEG
ncbi:glycosyltransferase [Brevibacillus ginsengisoli]|uniref:glycosyltransferase n=1 Tax=Brevibacillus ginsengisoli TaxID=363854 RepID=UPI003CF77862